MAEINVEEPTKKLESLEADAKINVEELTKNLKCSITDGAKSAETLESSVADIKTEVEKSSVASIEIDVEVPAKTSESSVADDAKLNVQKSTENSNSSVTEAECLVEELTENLESAVSEVKLNVEETTKNLESPVTNVKCDKNVMAESDVEVPQNAASSDADVNTKRKRKRNGDSECKCNVKKLSKKLDSLMTMFQDIKKTAKYTQVEVSYLRYETRRNQKYCEQQDQRIQSVKASMNTLKKGLENSHDKTKVILTIQSLNGYDSLLKFKLSSETPLKKVMEAYCKNQKLDVKDVNFMFEDKIIKETDTPLALGLKNDDVISATFIRHPSVSYIW